MTTRTVEGVCACVCACVLLVCTVYILPACVVLSPVLFRVRGECVCDCCARACVCTREYEGFCAKLFLLRTCVLCRTCCAVCVLLHTGDRFSRLFCVVQNRCAVTSALLARSSPTRTRCATARPRKTWGSQGWTSSTRRSTVSTGVVD